MKAFTFRLDQALRWRATQVDVEKAKVAMAANALNRLRVESAERERELTAHSLSIGSAGSDGATLTVWSAWEKRTRAAIQKLHAQERQAEVALAAQITKLAEANRHWQAIDNLKGARQARWKAEFDKELESFATESFLGRLQSKKTGA